MERSFSIGGSFRGGIQRDFDELQTYAISGPSGLHSVGTV